jgi:hypothetical protein
MQPFLYLWKPLREKYIGELSTIVSLFFEKIYPVFANAEEDAEAIQNKAWDDFMSQPCSCDEDYIDPSDFADSFIEFGIEQYEIFSLMRYRTLAMWIICLCQTWEQQLIKFLIDEGKKCGLIYESEYIKKGFGFIKDAFLNHGIDFGNLKCWEKVNELRKLVNTLKHADGDSADSLRKLRPDYFDWGMESIFSRDTLEVYGSTLLDETLRIKPQDFKDYLAALVAFWNELPEDMVWCEDDIS